MCVLCFYDTIILFYCIPLVYENKTYIYIMHSRFIERIMCTTVVTTIQCTRSYYVLVEQISTLK